MSYAMPSTCSYVVGVLRLAPRLAAHILGCAADTRSQLRPPRWLSSVWRL
jgi:hypothetical protein